MKLAVIGSGLMGGGVALDAARRGLEVRLHDARPDGVARLRERAARTYDRWAAAGRMTAAEAEAALGRLVPVEGFADLGAADVILEAVFEDLAVKREVLAGLEAHLGAETIVATNTSALRVGEIARGFPFADRVLGLHYFSPAEICPLVELVRPEGAAAETIARARDFLDRTGRVALACADTPGFALNRFFCPYYNEALRIAEEGLADPDGVDAVARLRLGAAAGPFRVLNLIGPRVAAQAMANLAGLGPFYAPSPTLAARGAADAPPFVLAEDAPLPAAADEVEDRLLAAIALPALELMAEGGADPQETDRGATLALKFARGPYALLRACPPARLEAALAAACARRGAVAPRIVLPAESPSAA